MSRSWTITPPIMTLSRLMFPFTLIQFRHRWYEFDSNTPSKTIVWCCESSLPENWYFEDGEVPLYGHLCVTSLLLCIVGLVLEYCSHILGTAAHCHLQLLKAQVHSVERLCPDQGFSLSHHIASMCTVQELFKLKSLFVY